MISALDFIIDTSPTPDQSACMDDEPAPPTRRQPRRLPADQLSDLLLRAMMWAESGRGAHACRTRLRVSIAYFGNPRGTFESLAEVAQVGKSTAFRCINELHRELRR